MNQDERLNFMLNYLINENKKLNDLEVPSDTEEKRLLLRALMNIRAPQKVESRFLKVQDEYLQIVNKGRGITHVKDLKESAPQIYIWRGDITSLDADGIVNAANSGMTGCYRPLHSCIDNCIHTYAGIQLRYYCSYLMAKQGHEEPTGYAKITPSYNLPSKYVIHTVGPIVNGKVTDKERFLLKKCYLSCLKKADEYLLKSIAFCCISTGVFSFPNKEAAQIATNTVKEYLTKTNSKLKVVFNVFKKEDEKIYEDLI